MKQMLMNVFRIFLLLVVLDCRLQSAESEESNIDAIGAVLQQRGVKYVSAKVEGSGASSYVCVSFAGMTNPCLFALKGMRIDFINLSSAKNVDWASLSNIPLKGIEVIGTNFENLDLVRTLPLDFLLASYTKVQDLEPLRNQKLKCLHLEGTEIKTLEAIRGMNLEVLNIGKTKVSELNPLEIKSLTTLMIDKTDIKDLTPLRDARLELLLWSPEQITNGVSVVRNMATLKSINRLTPNEFWSDYESRSRGPGASLKR